MESHATKWGKKIQVIYNRDKIISLRCTTSWADVRHSLTVEMEEGWDKLMFTFPVTDDKRLHLWWHWHTPEAPAKGGGCVKVNVGGQNFPGEVSNIRPPNINKTHGSLRQTDAYLASVNAIELSARQPPCTYKRNRGARATPLYMLF